MRPGNAHGEFHAPTTSRPGFALALCPIFLSFPLPALRLTWRLKMTRTRIATATAVVFAFSIAQASADTLGAQIP